MKSNQFYCLKSPTGKVAILNLAVGGNLERAIEKFKVLNFDPVEVFPITKDELPKDREFRNAWVLDPNKKVTHDLEKAKRIVKDRLRTEREEEFTKLDVDVTKALAQGDSQKASEAESKRQKLRDVTNHPVIENATTIESLKGLILSDLVK